MTESELINRLQNNPCENDIRSAVKSYPESLILNYLVGECYHRKNNECWQEHMKKCIKINWRFPFAYYKLCEVSTYLDTIKMLTPIFNAKTMDYDGKLKYVINEQLRIVSLLGPAHDQTYNTKAAISVYKKMYDKYIKNFIA